MKIAIFFSIDANGKNAKELTPHDGVRANIENILKDNRDHIIVMMNEDDKELFEPYKIHIQTGEIKKLYSND